MWFTAEKSNYGDGLVSHLSISLHRLWIITFQSTLSLLQLVSSYLAGFPYRWRNALSSISTESNSENNIMKLYLQTTLCLWWYPTCFALKYCSQPLILFLKCNFCMIKCSEFFTAHPFRMSIRSRYFCVLNHHDFYRAFKTGQRSFKHWLRNVHCISHWTAYFILRSFCIR
jgi:hypothetical protein